MGENAVDDGSEFSVPSNEVLTVVLLGKTGNGKSSTGNSIIGRSDFESKCSSAGVTCTCELKSTRLEDGRILNVIDTPGLFDFSAESEFIVEEIVKCVDMARGGIHALLVVLSAMGRFTREIAACIKSLNNIFGGKINDYMIVVFTGGDSLNSQGLTLDNYLGSRCPEPLEEVLKTCDNRYLLFDNNTSDELKKSDQMNQLLLLVNKVVDQNDGKPFTNELFVELKMGIMELDDKSAQDNPLVECTKQDVTEQLKRLTEMVEARLKEATAQLKQQLDEERAARLKAEEKMESSRAKSKQKIRDLREDLDRTRTETENLRHKAENIHCAILRQPSLNILRSLIADVSKSQVWDQKDHVIGIRHHPRINLAATCGADRATKLWK